MRQVVFPIEILPLNAVLVSMVAEIVGFVIIIVYTLVRFGDLPWTYLLLPVAVGLQVVMMTGIALRVVRGHTIFCVTSENSSRCWP